MASFKARSSFYPPPALVIDTETAYDIFGHLNPEALAHLQDSCARLEITGGKHDPNCQVCRQGDAKRRISRQPTKPVELLFHELVWDNIAQERSFGDHTKVSHLYCPWLGFYFVYSLTNESIIAIIAMITYTFNYIKL